MGVGGGGGVGLEMIGIYTDLRYSREALRGLSQVCFISFCFLFSFFFFFFFFLRTAFLYSLKSH